MDVLTSAGMVAGGLAVGLLTGITGMGGILIPPIMIALLGLTPHLAMGTSLASFLPACLLAVWMHHRQGNIRWNLTAPLAGAGILCVFMGTELKASAPGAALNILLSALVIGVGAMTLRPAAGKKAEAAGGAAGVKAANAAETGTAGAETAEKDGAAATNTANAGASAQTANRTGQTSNQTSNRATGQTSNRAANRTGRAEGIRLAAVGGAVGVMSGLTGAGGSVLTVPIMILMGYAPLTAVASGLAYVVAVSAVGTVGNALHQAVDFPLAGLCAVGQIAGMRIGIAVAGRLNARILRLLVAWVCVLTGVGILAKTLL